MLGTEITDADLKRFRAALDWRLLDHATGSGILSVEEYEHWQEFQRVEHINTVVVVEDAVAAAAQETLRNRPLWRYWFAYREARMYIGARPLDWVDKECENALACVHQEE